MLFLSGVLCRMLRVDVQQRCAILRAITEYKHLTASPVWLAHEAWQRWSGERATV